MKIGKTEQILITQSSVRRPDFGDACTDAYSRALDIFGIGEFGHSEKVDFERSTDHIEVEFKSLTVSGSMCGINYTFIFEAWIDRCEDDDD